MGKRDFARIEFKMGFGLMCYIEQGTSYYQWRWEYITIYHSLKTIYIYRKLAHNASTFDQQEYLYPLLNSMLMRDTTKAYIIMWKFIKEEYP